MEDYERQEEIVNYLNKDYYVNDSYFFNRQHEQEWGLLIIETLTKVFCHDVSLTENTLKEWAYNKGLSEEDYIKATGTRKLKATWSPEMAQDLGRYGVIDAEEELLSILSEQIAREIDAQILLDLKGQLKGEDFLGVMECVGYTTTPLIYDPITFAPKRGFISMKYYDIQYARQNNIIWKNWVRTREQNQQAQ
jgi:hypothetical protein